MRAERSTAFQELVVDEFWVGEIGTLVLERRHTAGVRGSGSAHPWNPWVVVTTIMLPVSMCRASNCGRWVREVMVQHGDEIVGDLLAQSTVQWESLEHPNTMFKQKLFVIQWFSRSNTGDSLCDCHGIFGTHGEQVMAD